MTTPARTPRPDPANDPAHGPPHGARAAACGVVRTLRDAGHVAYFAGGCVRDELLGIEPADYDVATDATPDRISALFRRTSQVGASFGVVLVKLHNTTVEVATFRSDGDYSDRRRPDRVTFSDPQADARRRDFTINALFLDPLNEAAQSAHGHVIDYVGGQADLNARLLRAVGDPDQRLAEDHLRALRAVRLAARLDFSIDPATAQAIHRHARELSGVSRERIGEELRMMLSHPSRANALRLLHELDLDAPVLGEDHRPASAADPVAGLAAGGERVRIATALAAWAIGRFGSPQSAGAAGVVQRWRGALCLSNDETDDLRHLLTGAEFLEQRWAGSGIAVQKRAAATPWFAETVRLVDVRDRDGAARIRGRVAELRAMPPGIGPAPLVSGEDLIAQGLTPSPAFKAILERVYDSQLEAAVATRDQALALALDLARSMGV